MHDEGPLEIRIQRATTGTSDNNRTIGYTRSIGKVYGIHQDWRETT